MPGPASSEDKHALRKISFRQDCGSNHPVRQDFFMRDLSIVCIQYMTSKSSKHVSVCLAIQAFRNSCWLKVGGSWFLWDYECRHDTIIDIFLSRAGMIAIKFNDRIVLLIFDINHVYLLFKKIIFNKNDVYLQFNSIKLSESTVYDWMNGTFR